MKNGGLHINLDALVTSELKPHIIGTIYAGFVEESAIGFWP